MTLTRTPSFEIQSTASSPSPSRQSCPSRRRIRPRPSVLGTPLWWSAVTSHWSLKTGEPELPGSVSVWYCRKSSSRASSRFSRMEISFSLPLG